MDKTGTKTGTMRSPRSGAVVPTGAHPKNTGGKKGRSGRHPDVFKQFLARLRGDPKFHKAIRDAARDSESRGFSSALKLASEYDEAKPASRTDVTSKGQQLQGVVILPATSDE